MTPKLLLLGTISLCAASALADDALRSARNVDYGDSHARETSLDVYAPPRGDGHPVVVWIHGGAWQFGDKAGVQSKPAALNERGYALVSINYRLHPQVDYRQQAGDVAQAVRWVRDHAREFGGDPEQIFLMGHSAGAHLAALVATDERYLKAEGLDLGDVKGVILLDGAGYDIPRQVKLALLPRMRQMYESVFSTEREKQEDASPITHVRAGKRIPPFLILYVADRLDSRLQSEALARKLRGAGGQADAVPAEGKTHMTINRELGQKDDPPTEATFKFLDEHTRR